VRAHGETKTEPSRRTLALPAAAVQALRAWSGSQAGERLAAGEDWQDTAGIHHPPQRHPGRGQRPQDVQTRLHRSRHRGQLDTARAPDGRAELAELHDGAAKPDRACRGVDIDKAERDKPASELAVADHEMDDGTSAQINDQPAHFAADPSVQLTSAPIVNGVVPAMATPRFPGL
jgi:hypothetical protein